MRVLGIDAVFHDSSAALAVDGEISRPYPAKGDTP